MKNDSGVYYFLGNITSHILHALPLHKELGGTFVVLSHKAKREVEQYGVPVIAIDNKPHKWMRFGYRLKLVFHYLKIGSSLKKTTDFLNANAKVVLFYELYDFDESVRLTKPKTVFLTHGNMLKDYMANNNRLKILDQYDYMAAIGPYLKKKFIEEDGIDPAKLVDLGIARTDEIIKDKGKVIRPNSLINQLSIDPAKKIFAYLPTFWGPSSIYTIGQEIVRNFPDEYTLIFRPHPQTPRKIIREYLDIIKNKSNVVYAPEGRYEGFGLIELFAASSAVIGDVSSVMLEAILTEKPLIIAQADTTEQHQGDSNYAAISEIVEYSQSITATTVKSLNDLLAAALRQGIDKKIWEAAATRNFYASNGTSTHTIVDFIRKLS